MLARESDIVAAYRLILDRDPVPGEESAKQESLCSDIFRDLLFSEEFVNRRLCSLRENMITGFTDHVAPWFDRYKSILERYRQGQKLSAKSSDHAEFLAVAYLVILRRIPDPMGFFDYIRQLEDGSLDRPGLIGSMVESEEARSDDKSRRFFEYAGAADSVPEQFELPDPDRHEGLAGEPKPSSNLLIVSGPPRSGTTVLAALLNAHPRICITYESRIFSLPDQLTRSLFVLPPSRAGAFETVRDVAEKHIPATVRQTLSGLRKYDLVVDRSRCQVYRIARRTAPPLFVGDKNPAYIAEAAWTPLDTNRAFPDARWILIFRSPREICHSQMRLGMVRTKEESCAMMRHCFENALQLRRLLGADQCFITTHDRMFSAATYVEEVARLASFLELADVGAFAEFAEKQIRDPERYSSADCTQPTRTSREEIVEFFADQPDAALVNQLVTELGLWRDTA